MSKHAEAKERSPRMRSADSRPLSSAPPVGVGASSQTGTLVTDGSIHPAHSREKTHASHTRTHALDGHHHHHHYHTHPEDNSNAAIYRNIMKSFDELIISRGWIRRRSSTICTNCGQIILVLLTGFPTQRCCSLVGSRSTPPRNTVSPFRRGNVQKCANSHS